MRLFEIANREMSWDLFTSKLWKYCDKANKGYLDAYDPKENIMSWFTHELDDNTIAYIRYKDVIESNSLWSVIVNYIDGNVSYLITFHNKWHNTVQRDAEGTVKLTDEGLREIIEAIEQHCYWM